MGIYRGAGGSGDAVNDASSEALITIQARDAALAAQAAAEAAQTAAELAETNAETAETNAETAETNAETAATNAASSASAASTSASNAATSATNAANSATAAQTAETNAETAETNAAASASAASTSASNAATSATNASNSASAAATSATNASNSASAAATSATNAANSATAAQTARTAAELAETNAETAEANAETAETNAAASASAAATSASNASTSASNAATSATNASNSASAAATSATNASNSASAASTSATNASNSASAAATSATNAAASYDSFDDRYLGAKSSAPTLDNDGNTLLTGALYFDTVSSSMKVWSGSAWLDAYASLSGALLATNNLSDLNNTATARTNLGVAIGVNVQAYDAQLADIAGLTPTDNNFIVGNGTNFVTESGSTARTSLGLGSIATQDANNVAVTGGSINGTTVGASTPSTGSFTSLTDSGNLTFTGTGNRITGDFSSAAASVANRVMFQTSTANSATRITAIPNGTNQRAFIDLIGSSSDPANASNLLMSIHPAGSVATIESTVYGTGTYLPLTMFTGGSERLRIDTSGNVGVGTSSPASRLEVQEGGTGSSYGITSATATGGGNAGYGFKTGGTLRWWIDTIGSAGSESLRFYSSTASAERMRIDASGNVGIGTSSPASFTNFKYLQINATSNAYLKLTNSTTGATINDGFDLVATGSDTGLINRESGVMFFSTSDTERMRIDSSGNVGIGTSSPASQLHVSSSGSPAIRVASTAGSGGTCVITAQSTGNTVFDSGSAYVFNIGSERMRIDSSGNVGIGNASAVGKLEVYQNNNSGVPAIYARQDGTAPIQTWNVAAGAERMRISSGGDVGIGTSSPAVRLHVSDGGDAGDLRLRVGNTRYVEIIRNGTSDSWLRNVGNSDFIIDQNSSGNLIFRTNATERMRLTSTGQLRTTVTGTTLMDDYGCRAWVNFNGTGTVAIRASGNVSSITDDGTGTYTINFSTSMPDANYAVVSNGPPNSTSVVGGLGFVVRNSSPSGTPSIKSTSQVQMMYAGTGNLVDASELYAAVFR